MPSVTVAAVYLMAAQNPVAVVTFIGWPLSSRTPRVEVQMACYEVAAAVSHSEGRILLFSFQTYRNQVWHIFSVLINFSLH